MNKPEELAAKTQNAQLVGNNYPLSSSVIIGLFSMFDTLAITVSGFIVYKLVIGNPLYMRDIYYFAIIFAFTSYFFIGRYAGLYTFSALMTPGLHLMRIAGAVMTIFLLLMALGFSISISEEYSRVWLYSYFLATVAGLFIVRLTGFGIIHYFARKGIFSRNIVIFGAGEQTKRLVTLLHDSRRTPLNRVVGIFDDRKTRGLQEINGLDVQGNMKDMMQFCRRNNVDDVIVALPWNADERQSQLVAKLRELPAHVHLVSDLVGFRFPNKPSPDHFGNLPMIEVVDSPLSDWSVMGKWLEDRILSTLLILIFGPVLLCIALAIKLESRGPVMFKQKRYGYNNHVFEIYKFRSMYHNGEIPKKTVQATKDDPRITRVGKFIRRTSLDELPQLFNVFLGSMSLVGPRPHAVDHNEEYSALIDGYFARHRMKPGITGWAQVNGLRGETDTLDKMEARVEYDSYYCEHWSLFFDLKILIMTAFVGFLNKNAY